MKVILCGAGRITRELLKRMGENWEIILIDKSLEQLNMASTLVPEVSKTLAEDASSSVVLEKAGIKDSQYILILTGSDEVNLAVAKIAVERKVPHILALVHEMEHLQDFEELEIQLVKESALLAGTIYHYLQDPRIHVMPLMSGRGSVMEVKASDHFRVVGKRSSYFMRKNVRLAGIIRDGELMFPGKKTVVKADDKLIILGEPEMFQSVCTLLECGNPHFPLAYGQGLMVGVPEEKAKELEPVLSEGLYVTQNTKVGLVNILSSYQDEDVEEHLESWPQSVTCNVRQCKRDVIPTTKKVCSEESVGLVVIPPLDVSFFKSLTSSTVIELAHELKCPLLLSRTTFPYERILVPFSGTPMSELALEVAVDISKQLGSELTVVAVEEPEFISGDEENHWIEQISERISELSHIHKISLEKVIKKGNPVKEIVELSRDFDLLVLGSTEKETGLLSPNVGEHLARKSGCSVLIVTN